MFLRGSKYFFFILILTLNALVSCQYRFGHGELSQKYRTISIPYVENDQKGFLTTEVIKRLSHSGALTYVDEGGELILKIKFVELSDENIDFRYDRKKRGKLKKSIIPTETRFTGIVEVILEDARTNQLILGPTQIEASVEFDHTYYTTRDEINIFSLGQLTDIDAARDAAMQPLNRCLAERIVDFIVNSW